MSPCTNPDCWVLPQGPVIELQKKIPESLDGDDASDILFLGRISLVFWELYNGCTPFLLHNNDWQRVESLAWQFEALIIFECHDIDVKAVEFALEETVRVLHGHFDGGAILHLWTSPDACLLVAVSPGARHGWNLERNVQRELWATSYRKEIMQPKLNAQLSCLHGLWLDQMPNSGGPGLLSKMRPASISSFTWVRP